MYEEKTMEIKQENRMLPWRTLTNDPQTQVSWRLGN